MRRLLSLLLHVSPVLAPLPIPSLVSAQGRIVERPCAGACARITSRSSATRVVLSDRVLTYEVTEVFRNSGSAVGEADYLFPLPAGAAFENLKLSINGELVAGETLDAAHARRVYEDIVRRQRDPALVEWMGSGLLRARIFPIQPGEDKTVVVRFQSVAIREADALRIDSRRNGDFTLEYPQSALYGDAYSPTHVLSMRADGRIRTVTARGDASTLTMLVPLRQADAAGMSVLTQHGVEESGFAMLTVSPPASTVSSTPRDLTFVLDVSGSMSGRKLEQAKAAGEALLTSLQPRDRFRVIDFSTDVRVFREGWTDASRQNVRDAHRYLTALRAEGSTNISEALRVALSVAPALERAPEADERLPLVVFITDGEPTVGERNPDAIAALAATLRRDARVFTFGVGTGVNVGLVEQLALQGRGTAHFVRDDESVEAPVSLLARRLSAPSLTDVRISATGITLSRVMPNGPMDIFAGQDLVILARYDGAGEAVIRLDGRSPRGPVTWTTRTQIREAQRANPFIPRLWAAQRLGWLAAEKRRSGTTEFDPEIRALGERYGIPTEFSSYLVVEPGMAQLIDVRRVGASAVAGGAIGRASPGAPMPAPTAPHSGAQQFEAARDAAARRDTKTLASLDLTSEADARTGRRTTRVVGNRRFSLAAGVWTDARFQRSMRTFRVRPFSLLYFELLRRMPDLQDVFALGDQVIVAGRAIAIVLAPEGNERVDERELADLRRDW